jgi:alpha-D-xyloside xylohydrolase
MKRVEGRRMIVLVAVALLSCAALGAAVPEKTTDGIVVSVGEGWLKVAVCADDVVRVAYAKDRAFFSRPSLATAPRRCEDTRWKLETTPRQAKLSTARLGVEVDLVTGRVAFVDPEGRPILAEKPNGRAMTGAEVQGEQTFHVAQQWEPDGGEALYGLGQHQLGLMNIKGYDLDLWQHNGTVIVPFLVSSRGYGILWDNTSFTRFGDLRPFAPIPAERLLDASGKPGGLSGAYYAGKSFDRLVGTRVDPGVDVVTLPGPDLPSSRIHPDLPAGDFSVRWEGAVEPETTGDHLLRTYSNNGIKLWIDDRLVIDHWRQGWLPWYDIARVRLEAKKRYRLKLEWTREQGTETMRLLWKTPAPSSATSLWSEVGEGVDYYFVYGPELDSVVAGYRRLTGEAPMMPRWAYGMWQCRERYKTAQESLDVLEGFRSRGIPIDNIVQDWFYWKEDQWGSHEFDPARFPDPEGWIRTIHDKYHARLMISAWPKFYPDTENAKAMRARGFLYELNLREGLRDWVGKGYVSTFYDAFNPEARKLYWSQVESALFRKNVDAWWLDATEPDMTPAPTLEGQRTHMHATFLGTGSRMLNAYSLLHSEGVYLGQRAQAPNQRVFILTRSGFAGQQRYAAATWSGDITSTWTAFKAQIPAGLSFSLSGIPYWTTDIGGFSVPARFEKPTPESAEEWRELNARWYQFGTFCPLLRVHGQFPYREMWELGGESHPAYQTELKFDRLRYRLLPYIYSLGGAVTHASGTIMRALVMDFRQDPKAAEIGDQFLFGPALLVSPVTTYKARSRAVYLPQTAGWYDFWTGQALAGGQTIDAPAPYEALPLHVRAGAIIPFGPELAYTAEKPADPITVFVYSGADGAFTLYEDEGLSYDYEKGAFTRIPLTWNEATRTLTIGTREGAFPGMLAERTFEIVLVSQDRPVGFSFTPKADRTVRHTGEAVTARFD